MAYNWFVDGLLAKWKTETLTEPVAEKPKPVVQRVPVVQAEALLRRVLPEENYLELAATSKTWIQAKTNRYQLIRHSKTIVEKPDKTKWSSCIHLSDNDAPDTDRLVAEYLLIVNDEKEYLKTANLTEIQSVPQYQPQYDGRRIYPAFEPDQFRQAVITSSGGYTISTMTSAINGYYYTVAR